MGGTAGGGDRTVVDDGDTADRGKGTNAETVEAIGAEGAVIGQAGIAGAAFGEEAEGVHSDGLHAGGAHHGGVAVDRSGVNPGVVADAGSRQGIVDDRQPGRQRIVVVHQNTHPGTHIDVALATAGGLGPDAVTAKQGDLTAALMAEIDRTAAAGVDVDAIVLVADHAVENIQRGA